MGQVTSGKAVGCPTDTCILTDDALVVIFSFLNLYERLMIMRTSKRYNRLLSNPQSWTDIDFWHEQQLKKNKTWMFPTNQHDVLAFLKKYTSGSLKAIYLKVVSEEILTFLRHNCPNLKVLSFFSGNTSFESVNDVDEFQYSFQQMLPLSQNFEVCQLTLNLERSYRRCYPRRRFLIDESHNLDRESTLSENVLNHLGTCHRLQRLTLHKFILTSLGIAGLSANPPLDIRALCLLQVHVPDRIFEEIHPIDEALSSLFKFTKLTYFRFSTNNPSNTQFWFNVDHFLRGMGKWQNLKRLGLAGIKAPSCETFSLMISGLEQLQALELEGRIITDENLHLLAQHFKNLTSLELTNGAYTNAGLKALSGYPSVERLCLFEHNQPKPMPSWLLAVYDVLLSLPKISNVKLIGNRLIALHAKTKIPKMIRNVKIDVENSEWWESI